MMHFSFWKPVYYQMDSNEPGSNFPSRSNDKNGHWVGFADNVGNQLTWKILTEDAHQIIFRSSVHSTLHTTLSLQQELSSRRAPLLLLLQPPFPTLCLSLKHTSGNMLMEVDWGGNLKHNYTSSGSMLMEVNWGDKLIINSTVDWRTHETHQMDTTSLKLTGEAMVPGPTIWLSSCSLKLIGELMTQVSSFFW